MKIFLIIIGTLIAALLLIAAVLPKDFKIEKSLTINKPKADVFAYLKSLENSKKWQPWAKMDPNMKEEFKGVDGTVGATSSWVGNKKVGVGEQEIINIVEGERIDIELRFKEPMATTNFAYFTTESIDENQTKVTWGMKGRTKFPFNIVCHFMHGVVEKNFEAGLAELKKILEK